MSIRVRVFCERFRKVSQAARHLEISSSRATARFLRLHFLGRFSSDEIFSMALLDPEITPSELRAYVSKERAWPVYERLNAHGDRLILNDKWRFYAECLRHDLPILPVHATLSLDEIASLRAQVVHGDLSAYRHLVDRLPERFVIKPSHGLQGKGVEFFRRQGDAVFTWIGTSVAPIEFVQSMWSSVSAPAVERSGELADQILLIQRAGSAHPEIQALTGSEIMQSVRICTAVDDRGAAQILFSFCKFVVGHNLIDNFEKGKTGNLLAYAAIDNGRIFRSVRSDRALGLGRTVSRHPDTGALLVGFEMPYWREACELAMRAALAFKSCRSVGWDIGIGPDGPVLLEGNGTWDPLAPWYRSLPPMS